MTAVGPVSDHPIGSHGPALAPTPRDCASTHRRENSHVLSQVTALGPEGDAHRQIFDCLRSCATRQGWQSSRSYEPDSQLGFLWGITHWRTLGFEWYCKTTSTTESWPPDRAYKATVLEKDCHQGERIFYSVRVHALLPPAPPRQLTTTLELDGGEWPGAIGPPDLSWSNPGQLEITMTT